MSIRSIRSADVCNKPDGVREIEAYEQKEGVCTITVK